MSVKPGKPRAIFLMGPTASGKTALAIRLRERYPVDIVSVDSAQVYRGMDIGTAKPDAETLRAAPHALIDIREPTEIYSAAEFREDALAEMESIEARGRFPLLAGGTMLYFRALEHGLSELPSADAKIRAKIEAEAAEQGWPALHDRLSALDPVAAARIHPNDPQRTQRALEVIEITGRPMSELQAESGEALDWNVFKIVACPERRAVLHDRIERRFDQMMEDGFMDEMEGLYSGGDLDPDLPSMRSVGYRQAWGFLAGEYGAEEMRQKAVAATRQLAKRQITWLRQERDALWYDPTVDGAEDSVIRKVGDFLE